MRRIWEKLAGMTLIQNYTIMNYVSEELEFILGRIDELFITQKDWRFCALNRQKINCRDVI